jgi:hypothetical protein
VAVGFNEPKFVIEPSDYRCAACAVEVAVEAPFFSAVSFAGESFQRRSYCGGCWGRPAVSPEEVYAFWRSRRPAPQAGLRRIRFDPELVLEFFRRLGPKEGIEAAPPAPIQATLDGAAAEGAAPDAAAEPAPLAEAKGPPEAERARLRLVLALLCLRKKTLVFQSAASQEGREWLKLSEKADPARIHYVENPPQTDAQIEEVKNSLGDLLQMDLG